MTQKLLSEAARRMNRAQRNTTNAGRPHSNAQGYPVAL
jgi:hypothetical protein